MINKPYKKFKILALSFSLLISLFIGEIGARYYYFSNKHIPPPPYNARELDSDIGWIIKNNYSFNGEMSDDKANNYPISIQYDENGFREFDNDSKNKNVFFIGDSYTQAVEVSNNKTFYSILKDSLKFDLFAYGSAGYGTFQEFLILEKYIDLIKPDVVVLQLCSNDFIDNNYKLEQVSNYKVGKERPYLTNDNKVEYFNPKSRLETIKHYSNLLYIFCKFFHLFENTVVAEELINNLGNKYNHYSYSIKSTELSLLKIKNILPKNCNLIVFSSDYYLPQNDDFKAICLQNNIYYIDNIGNEIINNKNEGETVHSFDGYHWNELGHNIVANEIYTHLYNILKK